MHGLEVERQELALGHGALPNDDGDVKDGDHATVAPRARGGGGKVPETAVLLTKGAEEADRREVERWTATVTCRCGRRAPPQGRT